MFHDTASQCKEQGSVFQTLIVEAHGGGWSLALRKVVVEIARRQRALEGCGAASLRIAQRLSVGLQAENSHAVLMRTAHPEPAIACKEGADWAEGGQENEDGTGESMHNDTYRAARLEQRGSTSTSPFFCFVFVSCRAELVLMLYSFCVTRGLFRLVQLCLDDVYRSTISS